MSHPVPRIRLLVGLAVILALVSSSNSIAKKKKEKTEPLGISIVWSPTELEMEGAVWLGYLMARVNYVSEHKDEYELRSGPLLPHFEEEVEARTTAAQIYRELKESDPELDVPYFNDLVFVDDAGFMREYVWTYLRQETWRGAPTALRLTPFNQWRLEHLPRHEPKTQGSLSVD